MGLCGQGAVAVGGNDVGAVECRLMGGEVDGESGVRAGDVGM